MSQPVPEMPINVQAVNPYNGLDRGLFTLRKPGQYKFARVHAARTICLGPSASASVLEYQLMMYATQPTIAEEYAQGTILQAPDGTQWFDTLTRGPVIDAIMVEYWAIHSYLTWYTEGGVKLDQEEKDRVNVHAKTFTETMAGWLGVTGIELTAAYNAVDGQPLTRTMINLSIDYTKDNLPGHLDVTDLPATAFDPVRVALNRLKNV